MAEYISKEDLIKAIEDAGADVIADYGDYDCESGFSRDNLSQIINSIPVADVAPVVRCKDCNYYVDGCCIIHSEDPDVFSPGYSFNPEPNDFCSYGWRRGTCR